MQKNVYLDLSFLSLPCHAFLSVPLSLSLFLSLSVHFFNLSLPLSTSSSLSLSLSRSLSPSLSLPFELWDRDPVYRGIIKTHLPQSAFLDCVSAQRPQNSLFIDLGDVQNVAYNDMELYLSLVLALFAFSPTGCSAEVDDCVHTWHAWHGHE